MDDKTIKALQGSINKWDRIAKGEIRDHGTDNCPLCAVFIDDAARVGTWCKGCPVMANTGVTMCGSTPYPAFKAGHMYLPGGDLSQKGVTLALAERDYLVSLLPYVLRRPYEEKKSDNSSPVSNAEPDPMPDSVRSGGAR